MNASYAFASDPFADPFEVPLASSRSGDAETAVAVYAPAEQRAGSPAPRQTEMGPVAEVLRAAGFTQAAIKVAQLAGDERAAEWSAIATADAALASTIATHGTIGIPSVQIREDGSPRFVICGDDARALVALFTDEHGERGIDSELRLFLDEALRRGDRFVDAQPAAGFATLTAATREGVEVIALVDAARTGEALRRSATVSGCEGALAVRLVNDEQALVFEAHDGQTVLHAGHAGNVAVLLQAMREQSGAVPVDVVAWRCGTARDADYDAEAMQIAAAVLGVLGFQHFALAVGAEGVELAPAEAMASNTYMFSLSPAFMERSEG